MIRTIDHILSDMTNSLRTLLEEAFELGRAAGRADASVDLMAKINNVLSDYKAPDISEPPASPYIKGILTFAEPAGGRAAPGTVKPVIESLIRMSPQGLTAEEITTRASVKHNSVRGTLHTLKNEGKIERRGHRWFYLPQKNEVSDEQSVGDTSETSDHQPGAQGGEARPGGGT